MKRTHALGARASLELGAGRGGAPELSCREEARPAPDLRPLEVTPRLGLACDAAGSRLRVEVACVSASERLFAAGLEGLVLPHAAAKARPASATTWFYGPVTAGDRGFEQRASGAGAAEGTALEFASRHLLRFTRDEALLCSLACSEPAEQGVKGASGAQPRCAGVLDAIAITGDLAPVPAPGPAMRTLTWAMAEPLSAALVIGAGVLAVTLAKLWRR